MILLLPGFIYKFGWNKNLVYIFLLLLIVGIIQIIADNNNTGNFLKVYLSLVLTYFFYYYVICELEFNVEQMFKWYLKGCYIAALIGIFQFACFLIGFEQGYNLLHYANKGGRAVTGGLFGIRINSIFMEPTHLGSVLSAAFFIAVYNLVSRQNFYYNRLQNWIIIVCYLLAFSGMGQIGVFLTIIILAINFGFVRYVIIAVPVMLLSFNYLYDHVDDFRERFDSTYGLFVKGEKFELGKTHGSSFILYNNYVVATNNFEGNFLFGTGLGSHQTAFEKYSIGKDIGTWGFELNSADANSMFLRLMSETGLFGLGMFFIIMIKCYVKRDTYNDSYHWLISNGILIMILINLFRQGNYYLYGFPFFLMLYYYNAVAHKEFLIEQKERQKSEQHILSV
ncbi:MAG: hypothetical protein V4565_11030 [Bacteroidota bacterium]